MLVFAAILQVNPLTFRKLDCFSRLTLRFLIFSNWFKVIKILVKLLPNFQVLEETVSWFLYIVFVIVFGDL